MTTDTRPPEPTQWQVLQQAEAMRQERNRKIKHLMERRHQAQVDISDLSANMAHCVSTLTTVERDLAALLEAGEKKVVGSSLLTLAPNGGIHIEPVDVVSLL